MNRRLATILLLLLIGIGAPVLWSTVLRSESSRPLQGRDLATSLGCFACHGPEGRGGVANPGARRGAVPGFTGSTLMMYVKDQGEIRQYILDGRPDRLADDPAYREEMQAQAIRMPTYRGRVSADDVDLLIAYIRVVSGMIEPKDEMARRGLEVAQRMGCFGCHGALGMGGRRNPRSLKGYIPGYMGADLRDLAQSDDELRDWIRKGHQDSMQRNPIATWFLRRQVVKMPGFGRFLDDGELDALIALLHWIQAGGAEKEPLT